MPVTIYLTRHGQDEDNATGLLNGHRDRPLTELGLKQAHDLAQIIHNKKIDFDAIYTSPLKRALVTAQTVAADLGESPPIILDTLIERDFGVMSGEPISEIESRFSPDIIRADNGTVYFLRAPMAETWPDLKTRARRVLDWIIAKHNQGSVLLVSHGDIGKMLFAAYFNLHWKDALTHFSFGNTEVIKLGLDSSPETAKIVAVQQFNK